MSDDEQQVEGQDTPESPGFFDSYLEKVPEDGRETVAAYLKDAATQVNTRLENASELEKTWGPYKDVDLVSRYKPEDLSEILAWHQQVTSSEDAMNQWIAETAQAAGFTKAESEQIESLEEEGSLTKEEVQQLIADRAAEQVAPLEQRLQAFEAEKEIDRIETQTTQDLKKLEEEQKVTFSEDQKAIIFDLGMDDKTENWLQTGYDRFKQISAAAQKEFVEDKTAQPAPAVTTGANAASKPTSSFDEATKIATEKLRKSFAA